MQVLLLLLVGAVVRDDLGVAGVGGLAAEHDRRPLRAAQDFVQQGEFELAVTLAAEFGSEVGCPQPASAHLLLERVDDLAAVTVERHELLVRKRQVERLDLFADELVGPIEHLLVLGVGFEIPRHRASPSIYSSSWLNPAISAAMSRATDSTNDRSPKPPEAQCRTPSLTCI